jgi:hypothetical protein
MELVNIQSTSWRKKSEFREARELGSRGAWYRESSFSAMVFMSIPSLLQGLVNVEQKASEIWVHLGPDMYLGASKL